MSDKLRVVEQYSEFQLLDEHGFIHAKGIQNRAKADLFAQAPELLAERDRLKALNAKMLDMLERAWEAGVKVVNMGELCALIAKAKEQEK